MPFDGSGNFNRLENWSSDAAADLPINATKFDTEANDFAGGFALCLTRDGQGTPSAPVAWTQPLTLTRGSDGTIFTAGRTGGSNNPLLQVNVTDATGLTLNLSTAQTFYIAVNGTTRLQISATGFTAPNNGTAAAFIVTGATVPANGIYLPAANRLGFATNSIAAGYFDSSQNLVLTNALAVAQGGTGAATASGARSNLAVLAIANNLSDLNNAGTARTNLGLGSLATKSTAAAGDVSGGVLRQGSLGSGVVTVQSGGSASGGSDGDIFLIY